MKKALLNIFFLFFTMAWGQDEHTLSGYITDPMGDKIAYAVISVLSADQSSMITQTSSDINGFFTAKGSGKSVQIVILATGFEPYQGNFFVWDKGTSLETIVLKPSVTELGEVVITTSRKAPSIQLKEGKIIFSPQQNASASVGNAFETLRKTPAVLIDNTNTISILGKKGATVFINGKSTYMQNEDLANFLKSIPASQIKNIEVMLNPSAQYDAEGGAGIINIVLNKQHLEGTYLSVGSGVSYWEHLRNNTDISLQHNTEKMRINASYNHQFGYLALDYGSTRFQDDNKIVSISDDTDKRKVLSGNFGINYMPNKKNTLGINLTTNSVFGKGDIYTENQIYSSDNQLQKTLFALSNYFSQKANRYGINAFYEFKHSENQTYNLDADYVFFDGGTGTFQTNQYMLPNGNRVEDTSFLRDNTRKIHIFAMAFHQKLVLGKGNWASGLKFSQVSSYNVFDFYNISSLANVLDANRSNKFDYREKILAFYAQFRYPFTEKLSTEIGFRSEHTFPLGKLTPYAGSSQQYQENDDNYSNFFPSVTISYQKNEKTSYALSYTSRIARPIYQDLNPFSYPLDGLSSWKGNPFLLPQKIYKLNASATWNKTNFVLSYTLLPKILTLKLPKNGKQTKF